MKTKTLFSTFLILTFLLTACGQGTAAPAPVTQTPVATQPPTDIPTPTLLPTFMPNPLFTITPSPTAVPPYPTASMVKANAVAFIAENALWVANVDGSGERKITDIENNETRSSNYLLQWSPDGKWISYISGDDLWIISPDGSVKRKALSTQHTNQKIIRKYEWSPDSSTIAYAQAADWGDNRPSITIGLLNLATGKVSEIDSYQSPYTITLSWTPDGNYLLLSKDAQIFMFEMKTRETIKETAKERQCSVEWYDQLFWSPSGQRFALSFHGSGPYYSRSLCLYNLDGIAGYGINADEIHNNIYAIPPAWDQTGNYLYLVVRNYDDPPHPEINPDLRLVRFNIKTRKADRLLSLTETEPYDLFWNVSISPNGQILEMDSRSAESQQFYIMDLVSLSTTRFDISEMPNTMHFHGSTFWSADNRHVIFSSESNGHFYKVDVQTGEATDISGAHSVENWVISPIATIP